MIALNPAHETLLRALLRYREYSKLVSTYTSKLSEYIDPVTKESIPSLIRQAQLLEDCPPLTQTFRIYPKKVNMAPR